MHTTSLAHKASFPDIVGNVSAEVLKSAAKIKLVVCIDVSSLFLSQGTETQQLCM